MNLYIRADAGAKIGTGHIMRCIALAQAWRDGGGKVIFLSHCESDTLCQRIIDEGFDLISVENPHPDPNDLSQTLAYLKHLSPTWFILDGYHFTPDYQKAIRDAGIRLLIIDDMNHLPHYHADILLNQNIYAESLWYSCESSTKLLLGAKYVLLRREFLKWRGWDRKIPDVASKVLVTLGGSDPDNVTLKVIQALQKIGIPDLEVKIVVGPSNPHVKSLKDTMSSAPSSVLILENVNNMPELMAWADLAVSGGGSTSWELAFMGVPSVVLVMAENQSVIAEELGRIGIVFNLGWHEQVSSSQVAQAVARLLLSAEARAGMTSRGLNLVDGDGVGRVLMRVRGQRTRLRRVREEDGRLIWEWANDPSVRAVSFSSEPIVWEQHLKWFQSKLNDPDCIFYVALNEEDIPVGQIRYDVKNGEATVSISLGSSFRGKGYGNEIIELSSWKLFNILDAKSIHSYVKMGNEASVKMFLEAGFKKMGMEMMYGEQAVHLMKPKEGKA